MTMSLSIRIPARDQMRYLRGGCFVFAQELRRHVRRETGQMLDLMALWVDGQPEHAFLADREADCAYDARGRLPLDVAVLAEGSACAHLGKIAPITSRQMREWAKSMDPHNARLDIGRYVNVMMEDE
jgi:hypothetical protein